MIQSIRKRDGSLSIFDSRKIVDAIFHAAKACGGKDHEKSLDLAQQVVRIAARQFRDQIPDVEEVQDLVEKVLIENGHARTAKAYILYREKRAQARQHNALAGATIRMFKNYLNDRDWKVQENANMQKSVGGLNNYIREVFTKAYWLNEIYPVDIREAHERGDVHIHDLGFYGPYCAGWDLRQLLSEGFGGVPGKVESFPAKHLSSFLGQIVNSTFTTQGEASGAQAWSSFDTYCAPFIRRDGLKFEQVKQALQEFVFSMNVPTRVGFQCPFSNLTFDLTVPKTLRDQSVIIGGQATEEVYGDFQKEMDILNQAFCEVMMAGDSKGRVFTFPIPTLNVTKEFDWHSPAVTAFFRIAAKYGIPYFANYINSDLSPEDALSMCCRLRLNTKELRKRGGGLFASNPMTGSVGVFTINLPRIGYLSKSRDEFLSRLDRLIDMGQASLEIKRKEIEKLTEQGLYPYSKYFLRHIKSKTGEYWHNHFGTIGVVGMNEALLNFEGQGIAEPRGRDFAVLILEHVRDRLIKIQEDTGHVYNLEATPAEGTSYRLAIKDRERFPDIITAGDSVPYYTNSTHLPVGHTDDLFEAVKHQDPLQVLYTGGTVFHAFLGESPDDAESCKILVKRIFEKYSIPYLTLTPTFSICPNHGYLIGEQPRCPQCDRDAEVWSRIVGYLRPLPDWNKGKKAEFQDRRVYGHVPALT